MASRFWVTGGTGNWNSTTNWSATTGGASGASVPSTADTAAFDASSGAGTATLDISPTVQTLTMTGFTGTLAFGTNTISLNSTGTIFTGATTMAVSGTPLIICTSSTTTSSRTITPTAVTEANSISFRVTAGTASINITAGSVRDLDFTDGINPTGWAGALGATTLSVFGNFKASTGMTQSAGTPVMTFAATSGTKTINTAGVTFDRPFTFNGVGGTFQLAAALTSGATRTCTLTNGTLDLNNFTLTTGLFSSNNSNTRAIAFGTGKIVLTGTSGAIFNIAGSGITATGTNPLIQATAGGAGTRSISMAGNGEANAISVDVTAGSDIVALGTTNGAFKNVNFTGFTGTHNETNSISVYGNWNYGGVTATSGTAQVNFTATSGTKTITSNGVTFPANITFNGVGGTWSLQDALTVNSANTLTLSNGTLTTNGWAVTTGTFSSSNTTARVLNLGASTVTITGTGTSWNITDPTNMTLNAGTSSITTNGNTANINFNGGGLTYYNVTFGATYYNNNLSGANTFNNLTLASPAAAGRRTLAFTANQTISGTLTCSGSAANSRPRLVGATGGTTLTAAAVSLSNADFLLITAAGASSPWSGTRLGDGGRNTNITFATPKTVYWSQPAGGNWSDVAWALTSGGATGANNFPLAQDAVILDNTGVGASSTIVMDYGFLIPTFTASSLTNALTINWNTFASFGVASYGDITLSSSITITYTSGTLGIDSLTGTSIITTAGVSIPIATVNFSSLSKTVRLGDNFTSTGTVVGFTAGTLDLNGKTLSCVTFDSTFTDLEVRVLAFNSGNITVTGSNSTVWACENLTNFSYTGTPTVNFTYSGSTGTRTISNGNTAGGTEANAVDFNIVAGGDLVTSSNLSVVRNFTVQPAYTGTNNIFSGGFVYGNLLLSPNQLSSSTTSAVTFAATSGVKTITTNGIALFRNMIFDGVGGTWQLQDALNFGASGRTLTLTNGTFDANNYSVTGTRVSSSNSNVRTLKLGSANWTMTGGSATGTTVEWDFTNTTNLTVTGTGLIALNSFQVAVFQGGSRSWPGLVLDPLVAGAAQRWIYGSNTFGSITGTTLNYSVSFEAGTTQTVDTFNVSGTAGNLVTLNSLTPGTRWNIAKNTGGKVLVSYVSITDSAATPAGYWFAPTSQGNVDGGNNTGWNFASTGSANGFLMFF